MNNTTTCKKSSACLLYNVWVSKAGSSSTNSSRCWLAAVNVHAIASWKLKGTQPSPSGFLQWVSFFKSICFFFRSGSPCVYFQLRGTQHHSKCYTISALFSSQYVASLRTWQEKLQDLISSTEEVGTDRTLLAVAMGKSSQVRHPHENVIALILQSREHQPGAALPGCNHSSTLFGALWRKVRQWTQRCHNLHHFLIAVT